MPVAVTEKELIRLLNISSSHIAILFEINTEQSILSTGMVSIPTGLVTLSDIYRAMQMATNLPKKNQALVQLNAPVVYEVNNSVEMHNVPLGYIADALAVRIKVVNVPSRTLRLIQTLSDAFEHRLLSINAEYLQADS